MSMHLARENGCYEFARRAFTFGKELEVLVVKAGHRLDVYG